MATNKVHVFRLSTGEEVIATHLENRVDDQAGEVAAFEKVRVIQVMPTGPNQMGVGIIPYSAACVDGRIEFAQAHIIAVIEHGKEIEDAYIQQTTGIALATAGSIPSR